MNDPIRQHFLPQFYLEGFVIRPVSDPPKFWFFNFRDQKWHVRTPINTAVRKHYYTLKDQDESKNYYVEKYLSDLEGKVKDLLDRKIRKNLRPKTCEHIATLAVFVSITRTRVPFYRDKIEDFNIEIVEQMMSMMRHRAKTDPNYLKQLERDYERDMGEKLGLDQINPDNFMNTDKFKIRMNQNWLIGLSLSHIDKMSQILCDMKWTVYRTTPDAPFITCDNPYFEINPKSTSVWDRSGLLNKDIEIILPLDSQYCFFASWKKAPQWFSTASLGLVAEINLRIMLGAREFIISSSQDFQSSKKLQEIATRAHQRMMKAEWK
jgi:hypothetical protein